MIRSRKDDELPEPEPGPLGWFEFTAELMRDRSHSSWMLLHDDELHRVLQSQRLIAAYGPGEKVATPNLVVIRLAVSPQGRVGVIAPDGTVTEGEALEQVFDGLLEELRTVAFVPPDGIVGPEWLPAPEIVEAAHTPSTDSRVVYCYRGSDTLAASSFARSLDEPLTAYKEGGWIISVTRPGPAKVLDGPPSRMSGAYPFAVLERRGEQRGFGYAESTKGQPQVWAEWAPLLLAAPLPEGAGAEATALRDWLVDPSARPEDDDEELDSSGLTEAQLNALQDWRNPRADARGLFAPVAEAFGLPPLVVRIIESDPEDALPDGGREIAPASARSIVADHIREEDKEPTGRGPWAAVLRFFWHHPWLGAVFGAGEVLVGLVIAVLLVTDKLTGWWPWAVAAVFLLDGNMNIGFARARLRWRRQAAAQGDDETPPGDG